jgi:hypothetical protein
MRLVICPCCKGRKRLTLVEHSDKAGGRTTLSKPECTHCEGKGKVPAELDKPVVQNSFTVTVDPALLRNQMTPNEKREHLRSLGVKDNDDIEKIIGEVYAGSVLPHRYVPSTMHMGDCDICGHVQQSPLHI